MKKLLFPVLFVILKRVRIGSAAAAVLGSAASTNFFHSLCRIGRFIRNASAVLAFGRPITGKADRSAAVQRIFPADRNRQPGRPPYSSIRGRMHAAGERRKGCRSGANDRDGFGAAAESTKNFADRRTSSPEPPPHQNRSVLRRNCLRWRKPSLCPPFPLNS